MLNRRSYLKTAVTAFFVANIWHAQIVFARDGDIDGEDDWPPDEGWSDDEPPDPPEPPDQPEQEDSYEGGGFGADDRSQVDLSTGARSFEGPLLEQATASPEQFVDSLFRGLFFGPSADKTSDVGGDPENSRLMSQASSLARQGDENSDKDIVSFQSDFGVETHRSFDWGIAGGILQVNPEFNAGSATVFLGEGLGVWLNGTYSDYGAGTNFEYGGGVFAGTPSFDGFVGFTSEPSLEFGVMSAGQSLSVDINGPALMEWIGRETMELQRNIEELYGVPHL